MEKTREKSRNGCIRSVLFSELYQSYSISDLCSDRMDHCED